ncbi:MAG TPA: hypothetical protein VF516_30660 [Kofleriaceae bacterium]
MPSPSIAELVTAACTGSPDRWVQRLPAPAQPLVRRALDLDRPLWVQYPASLPSCLLARTLGSGELGSLPIDWMRELDELGAPWIRPLRPLPVKDGLLAELHDAEHLALAEGGTLSFASEDEVCVDRYAHTRPEATRRLRWSWTRSEIAFGPEVGAERPDRDGYPRIEKAGWGPAFVILSPGAARVELPSPPESNADARIMADGARVAVYGALEDYEGGFVHIVDLATMAIERSLTTRRTVSNVHECARRDLLLVATYGGLVAWRGDLARELPIGRGRSACLSPSGAHIAVLDDSLRLWALETVMQSEAGHASRGFPTCFDPQGDRLLSGSSLFEARSGRRVATLHPDLGPYLEGGPASPWMHLGTQYLVSLHGGLAVWDAHTGEALRVEESCHYPQWYSVAYDHTGARLAALRHDSTQVVLHALPSGRISHEIGFDLDGSAIAISPDGELLAIQCGGAVEVRAVNGTRVQRYGSPGTPPSADRPAWRRGPPQRPDAALAGRYGPPTLQFSRDGRRIARFTPDDGWRVWTLGDHAAEHASAETPLDDIPDFSPPHPADWTLEADSKTVFTHHPTGTRIALPAAGPWSANPAVPRILASDDLHIELRG